MVTNDSTSVWVVHHIHIRGEDDEDEKLIGVYSTEDLARAAVVRLSTQPGFDKQPENFRVSEFPLNWTGWEEGFVTIEPEADED